jgi:hypothetical protein
LQELEPNRVRVLNNTHPITQLLSRNKTQRKQSYNNNKGNSRSQTFQEQPSNHGFSKPPWTPTTQFETTSGVENHGLRVARETIILRCESLSILTLFRLGTGIPFLMDLWLSSLRFVSQKKLSNGMGVVEYPNPIGF